MNLIQARDLYGVGIISKDTAREALSFKSIYSTTEELGALRQKVAYGIIKKISGEQDAATFILTNDAEVALGRKWKIRKFYKIMEKAGFLQRH